MAEPVWRGRGVVGKETQDVRDHVRPWRQWEPWMVREGGKWQQSHLWGPHSDPLRGLSL